MKRLVDICGALIGIVLLLPVSVVVTLLIYLQMGRPFFFVQERSGLHGVPFRIYKFRTMTIDTDGLGQERITKLGRTLRKYSIDEWPQLLNILKGDMSFVGPRPLLTEYLPLYNSQQRKRLSVKPGITGWAQVQGRNMISWEQKFLLDCWYVENQSVLVDFKILLMTMFYIIRPKGVNQNHKVTMERFRGEKVQEELNSGDE